MSIDDYEERKERTSQIEHSLFDPRVAISRLTEEERNVNDRMSMMDRVNLPRIEVPKFDGNILNWRPFWEQFRAAVRDKPHLAEVDTCNQKRTCHVRNSVANTDRGKLS